MSDSTTKGLVRLLPAPTSDQTYKRFLALCDEIENRANAQGDNDAQLQRWLAEWNTETHRAYKAYDFRTYHSSTSKEEFVQQALMPRAPWIDDLCFEEACAAVAAVSRTTRSEAEISYLLELLEKNLPGSKMSDLIFWPNEWFKDESMLQAELTVEQIVGYAMARSDRELVGSPADLSLPYPVPEVQRPIRLGPPPE